MSRSVHLEEYECDENGQPVKDYDISELKQITESSNIRADANPNQMHYDSLKNLAYNADEIEAKLLIDILVTRHPKLVFDAAYERMARLESYFNSSVALMEDLNR